MLPSGPPCSCGSQPGGVLEGERQDVLGHLQRHLDGVRVALAGDDDLKEHWVAGGGDGRADLDVGRGGRGQGRRGERRGREDERESAGHLSLKVNEPRWVWPSAAFIVQLAL